MFFLLYLCCFVEGFSGGSIAHVGIMPTWAVPSKSSLEQFFFLFHGDRNTLLVRKKKWFWLCFTVLWCWLACSIVAGVVCSGWCIVATEVQRPSEEKKKMSAWFWVVEKLLCGPLLLLLLLFLYWPEVFFFSGKFQWSSASLRRLLSLTFLQFFDLLFVSPARSACRRPVLFIFGQFLHFPASLRESRSSDRCIWPALDSPARTDQVIVASECLGVFRREPIKWLFKFQTSFSTSVEVLFNYLVICLVCSKLF